MKASRIIIYCEFYLELNYFRHVAGLLYRASLTIKKCRCSEDLFLKQKTQGCLHLVKKNEKYHFAKTNCVFLLQAEKA